MKGMRRVLNSIIFSLGGLVKVFFIVFMVWLMFSIAGVKLFRNKFGYCETPENFGISLKQVKIKVFFIFKGIYNISVFFRIIGEPTLLILIMQLTEF